MKHHTQDHDPPRLAPAGKLRAEWTVDEILADQQARAAERREQLEASSYECAGETDPRRARAAFMANPDAVMTVDGRQFFHRNHADDRREPARPISTRRPTCSHRRRGTGRPAGRTRRRSTTRSGAASGDSGPSGSSDPGDGDPDHHPVGDRHRTQPVGGAL